MYPHGMPTRPHRANRAVSFALSAGLLCAIPPGVAIAQTTFELGDEGWTAAAEPEPGSPQAVLAEARRLIAEDKPGAALKVLNPFIAEARQTNSPWLPEALLLRGDADVLRGEEYEALYAYEEIATQFTGSGVFASALERELEIGLDYAGGLRRKVFGLRIENAKNLGEELIIRVQERLPGSDLAERAAIELADHYFRERDMPMAAEMYGIFLANYPASEMYEHAARRQILANVARFKGPSYDASGLVEARFLIAAYRARFPAEAERAGITDGLLTRIDESAAAQMLETARWYFAQRDEASARFVLRRLLRKHPASASAQTALRVMEERGWIETPTAETGTEPGAGTRARTGTESMGEGEMP